MFSKYQPGELPEAPPPKPVYARVDQTEQLDEADGAARTAASKDLQPVLHEFARRCEQITLQG